MMVFLLLVSLIPSPDSFASEGNSGAGLVLVHSIIKSREKKDHKPNLICTDYFHTKASDDDWSVDIYHVPLTVVSHPLSSIDKFRVFTRLDSQQACHPERIEHVVNRHPCLDGAFQDAVLKAIDLKEDLVRSYESLDRENLYDGNVSIESFSYSLIVQSLDPQISHIDIGAWDFSWLVEWSPWFGSQKTCPFQFQLRHETSENGRPKIIQQIPIGIAVF